jgi:hypothetical protein
MPGNTYHLRAYAVSSVGTSYGTDLTFTTTSTASTWFEYNGHCYELVFNGATWTDAKARAAASTKNGKTGYLAVIETAAENNAIFTAINPATHTDINTAAADSVYYHPDSSARGVWIGASDDPASIAGASEGNFFWLATSTTGITQFWQNGPQPPDGTGSVINGKYANFGASAAAFIYEPDDNWGAGQNHVAMQIDDWPYAGACAAGKWNDLTGSTAQAYLVEYDTPLAANAAPTIATAAAATPSPATGTTTALSVLGADDAGESALTYTWTTTGTPPAAVAFSANGTNAAKSTTATFTKAGSYSLQATIRDAGGLTVTSSVNVTVNQTTTTVTVSPATKSLNLNGAQTFTASAADQFGTVMSPQPTFSWAVTAGVGSINSSSGAYAAGTTAGSATVTATSGAKSGTASVTVTNAAPTVATAAAATPSPVTGTTTALSALGADDAGETALTYTWATTGTPPAAVAFSANGTNAAKSTTATFTKAGSYSLQVTIRDAGGLTVTSAASVTVNQTTTTVTVSPASAAVNLNGTQPFTASANDQFGAAMASQPTFSWAVTTGVGGINPASGDYSAGAVAGSATITATGGGKSGTASVTVDAIQEMQLPLSRGWNLISLPFDPVTPAVADCFSGAVTASNVWRWDAAAKQYRQVTAMKALEGYWVYAAADATVTVRGTVPANTVISLAAGWNLVGVAGMTAPAAGMQAWSTDSGSMAGAMLEVGIMEPLDGYWIFVADPTDWDAAGTP